MTSPVLWLEREGSLPLPGTLPRALLWDWTASSWIPSEGASRSAFTWAPGGGPLGATWAVAGALEALPPDRTHLTVWWTRPDAGILWAAAAWTDGAGGGDGEPPDWVSRPHLPILDVMEVMSS